MIIHPSILISLLLLTRVVSGAKTTLSPYFVKNTNDHEVLANDLLSDVQYLWPRERLTVQVLRKWLEDGENDKVANVLNVLGIVEYRRVLDAMMHPNCSKKMLENFKFMRITIEDMRISMITKHVYIHQPWEDTRLILSNLREEEMELPNLATALLIRDAFANEKFKLMKSVLNAISKKGLPGVVNRVLMLINNSKGAFESIKLFLLNDVGKSITPAIFKVLKARELVMADLVKLLRHPSVDVPQFAQIVREVVLSETVNKDSKLVLIKITTDFDRNEVRKALPSTRSQRAFLGFFGVNEFEDINLAWASLVFEEKIRHEKLCTKCLNEIADETHLPILLNRLVSEYAA